MLADLFRTRSEPPQDIPVPPSRDAAFEARARLVALRNALTAAVRDARPGRRWGEPPVFFFDRTRQAELEAARPATPTAVSPLAEQIAREVTALCESVDVRRAARAVPGLLDAANALCVPLAHGMQIVPSTLVLARELAALLAIPDDEAVLVLHPTSRRGFRLHVRGIADVNQFHVLMLDAARETNLLPMPLPGRFGAACREANPVVPAGVPMVVTLPFQLLRPGAVRADGTVPESFHGCNHWLWGWESLAAAPRVDGERVVLLSDPAFKATWEVERRFPAMAAEVNLLQVLSPFQVAERLSRLAGQPVPVHGMREEVHAKAA